MKAKVKIRKAKYGYQATVGILTVAYIYHRVNEGDLFTPKEEYYEITSNGGWMDSFEKVYDKYFQDNSFNNPKEFLFKKFLWEQDNMFPIVSIKVKSLEACREYIEDALITEIKMILQLIT